MWAPFKAGSSGNGSGSDCSGRSGGCDGGNGCRRSLGWKLIIFPRGGGGGGLLVVMVIAAALAFVLVLAMAIVEVVAVVLALSSFSGRDGDTRSVARSVHLSSFFLSRLMRKK